MTGRPTKYGKAITGKICTRLAEGESLRSICNDDGIPVMSTVMLWLTKHEDFSEQYTRARTAQAQVHADEITYIADHEENIDRARIRIDARKWAAARMEPKKYGKSLNMSMCGSRKLISKNESGYSFG